MDSNTIVLLQKLQNATNNKEISELSAKVSNSISDNSDFVESFLKRSITNIVNNYYIQHKMTLNNIQYNIEVKKYQENNTNKLAIMISILQDYRYYRDDFNNELLKKLVRYIKDNNYHQVIDDINVNNIQYINGEFIANNWENKYE